VFKKLRNKMAGKKETDESVETTAEASPKKANKKGNKKASKKDQKYIDEIETLKLEVDEQKDKYLRLFAEFDNFKKRNMKERLELMKSAGKDVMQVILPVLDDFDRAKKVSDDEASEENFSEGINLLYGKIYSVLGNKGLKAMESNGEAFDPELHEAITEIPAPTEEMKGKIIDTVEKGYYLNDKIIRYAKVVVGK